MSEISNNTQTAETKQTMTIQKDTSSYRNIFKATSLFGGVQVYQIIIGIVKNKFIALLLGPLGVGIQGLYHSALMFIENLTSMGLKQSAVRNVSEANGSKDLNRVAEVVKTLRRLVWCTGLLGLLVVVAFSPLLSKTSFGDNEHIVPFILLSVTLLLDQLSAGQKVVLQGMRRLKHLAYASAIGSTVSLLVSLPLYYLYGVKGIVPTLILNSVTILLLTWFYARKVSLPSVDLSLKQTFTNGAGMLKMGLAMSFSSLLVTGCAYVLRWYIRAESGTEAVGLYTAGFTIISTYVGMIFTAIGTDYYPRLAGANKDNEKSNAIINQQGEIAALIMAPMLMVCIVFMPFVIRLLYSDQFEGANDFVIIASIGMMFKLGSWLIAFKFIAKGESKLYVINETIASAYSLVINILGYKYFGLFGLGCAFTIKYIIYFIQVFLIARKKYNYRFSVQFRRIMLIQLVLLVVGFGSTYIHFQTIAYIIGTLLIIGSGVYSIVGLNKRIGILSLIKSRKERRK